MKIGKIEKKVEIPEVHSKFKYPWPDMEAGDSVLIEAEKGKGFTISSAGLDLLPDIMAKRPGRNSKLC